MWDINIDEPTSLRSKPRRPSSSWTWLIRCGFLSLHLALIGAAVAWVEGWPPFSGRGRVAAASSTLTRTAPTVVPARVEPAPTIKPGTVSPAGATLPHSPRSAPAPAQTPAPAKAPAPAKVGSLKELREDLPQAKPRPPEDILRDNGLTRSSGYFLLASEAEANRQLGRAQATFLQHAQVTGRQAEIQYNDARIAELNRNRVWVDDRVRATRIQLDALPKPGNNIAAAFRQGIYNAWIEARDALREIDLELGVRRGNRPDGNTRQGLVRERERLENAFREDVYGLRKMVDQTTESYQKLAQVEAVKDALGELDARKAGGKLGPSERFAAIRLELVKAEKELNHR